MDKINIIVRNYIVWYVKTPREVVRDIVQATEPYGRDDLSIVEEELSRLKEVVGNLVEILLSKELLVVEDVNYLTTVDYGLNKNLDAIKIERVKEK